MVKWRTGVKCSIATLKAKERPTYTSGGLARVYRGVLDYRGDGIPFQSGSGEPENDLHWSLEGPN